MILNLCILVVIKLTEIYFLPLPRYNPTKVFKGLKSASFYRGLFAHGVGGAVPVNLFGMLFCYVCVLWNLQSHGTLCIAWLCSAVSTVDSSKNVW